MRKKALEVRSFVDQEYAEHQAISPLSRREYLVGPDEKRYFMDCPELAPWTLRHAGPDLVIEFIKNGERWIWRGTRLPNRAAAWQKTV